MSAASSTMKPLNVVTQVFDGTNVSFLVAPWTYIKTVKAMVGNHEAVPAEKVQLVVNEKLLSTENDFQAIVDLDLRDQDVIHVVFIDPESSEDENPDDHKRCVVCGKLNLYWQVEAACRFCSIQQ